MKVSFDEINIINSEADTQNILIKRETYNAVSDIIEREDEYLYAVDTFAEIATNMLMLFLEKNLHPDILTTNEFDEELLSEVFEQLYVALGSDDGTMFGFILSMARVADGMRKLLESNLPFGFRRKKRRHDKTDLTDVYKYIKRVYKR